MKKMIAVLSAAVLCCGALTAPVFAEEEPAKEYMLGDIDEDGEVTVADAQLVLLSYCRAIIWLVIECGNALSLNTHDHRSISSGFSIIFMISTRTR